MDDRIKALGADVFRVPTYEELPDIVARIARLWAELALADRDLADELARKLTTMVIHDKSKR